MKLPNKTHTSCKDAPSKVSGDRHWGTSVENRSKTRIADGGKYLTGPAITTLLAISSLLAALFLPKPAFTQSSPHFYWQEPSAPLRQNQYATLALSLDSGGVGVNGADVMVSFNSNLLNLEQIIPAPPNIFTHNFVVTQDNSNPEAVTFRISSSRSDNQTAFTGNQAYLLFVVIPKAVGVTQIDFVCSPNATDDSNIANLSSTDILDCGALNPLIVNIIPPAAASTQPTPTLTPLDTASPEPGAVDTAGSASTTETDNHTALNGSGEYQGVYFSDTNCSLPKAPVGFNARSAGTNSIYLTWQNNSNAQNYSLFFGTNPDNLQYGATNLGQVNTFLVKHLTQNTRYYFRLSATNACGVGPVATDSTATLAINGTQTGSTPAQPEIALTSDQIQGTTSTDTFFEPQFEFVSPDSFTEGQAANLTNQELGLPLAVTRDQDSLPDQLLPFTNYLLGLLIALIVLTITIKLVKRLRKKKPPPQPPTESAKPKNTNPLSAYQVDDAPSVTAPPLRNRNG